MTRQRRSAKEWASLIRQLERSDESVGAFAAARGIRPETLSWWRWRLGRKTKPRTKRQTRASLVKLVAVQPAPDLDPPGGGAATPVWELIAPSGYELRVYDSRGLAALEKALFAVSGVRHR